ncbi:MAG: endonuclease III [Spirochaetales bacterium]
MREREEVIKHKNLSDHDRTGETHDSARIRQIHDRLAAVYPTTRTLLHYKSPFELLISVVLSAQTTDASVNMVTPNLFARYPDAHALARADPEDVEPIIKRTGFFRSKAKNIVGAARGLVERFDGVVPRTMEELTSLPGVGRKTAHVVRGTLFGEPSIIVDTHFGRVTRRLGLHDHKDPFKIEKALEPKIPDDIAHPFSMRINFHGRDCCESRKPACWRCPVEDLCPYEGKLLEAPKD